MTTRSNTKTNHLIPKEWWFNGVRNPKEPLPTHPATKQWWFNGRLCYLDPVTHNLTFRDAQPHDTEGLVV